MLHVALGRLRWSPDVAWRATPREIAAALARPGREAPMGSAELAALMTAFPDP